MLTKFILKALVVSSVPILVEKVETVLKEYILPKPINTNPITKDEIYLIKGIVAFNKKHSYWEYDLVEEINTHLNRQLTEEFIVDLLGYPILDRNSK